MIIFNAIQYDDLVNGFDMLAELRAILDKFLEISRPMSTIKGLCIASIAILGITWAVQYWLANRLKRIPLFKRGKDLYFANWWFDLHRSLWILCWFFVPVFFIQLICINKVNSNAEFDVSIVAFIISLLVFPIADFFVTRETKWAAIQSIVWYALFEAFILVRLVRFYTDNNQGHVRLLIRKSVFAFGVITATLLMLLIIVACFVIKYFDHGLYNIYAGDYSWIAKPKPSKIEHAKGQAYTFKDITIGG
ncbi:unnamed protein product [Ambrosiozyma monospora]|uniref:Unnamed protein product n=1 Tax=Ambrosiozyma monospora TaxID=43982 RepID=A0A9W6Z4T5_AMBMO|nr:unnamed protein product [Ambrosiozyma monospora]